MNKTELTVLKIGGSVITDKSEELTARTKEIDRLAGEIQKSGASNLIIIHGGGSFGHPMAEKYSIKEGLKQDSQKIGFSETHHCMTLLNGLVMDCLIQHEVPAVSISPSSYIITENRRIKHLDNSTIEALLKLGFIPVLYGDAVIDSKLGFTILSGDQLATALAMKFDARRVVFGVDVDGLYDADPKGEKTAKMYRHLNPGQLKEIQSKLSGPTSVDVTGGMLGKVEEVLPAVEVGITVIMMNASKPGNICNVLQGKEFEGTLIGKE